MVKNKEFYPCCLLFCCSSDPLEMTVRIPVGGYTPGQTINLDIEAKNRSDQDVEGFTAQLLKVSAIGIYIKQNRLIHLNFFFLDLLQHITYHIYEGSSRQKEETILIIENQTEGCLQTRNELYRVNLEIPPIPPTDDTTSNICKVRYFIRVSLEFNAESIKYALTLVVLNLTTPRFLFDLQVCGSVACCHNDPTIRMPVIIGSIPITDTVSFPTSETGVPSYNSVISQQPVAPPLPGANEPLLPPGQIPMLPYPPANAAIAKALPQQNVPSAPMFGDIDPPTYGEATHTRNADESNEKTNKKFNPKYPMFRRNTSYSSNN